MVTINNYLKELSYDFYIKNDSQEQDNIQSSLNTLKEKLLDYFNDIDEVRVFGSYERDTILPRYWDDNSDIDVLIVFSNEIYLPETYRNQLRKFAETYYYQSIIYKSHPSIVLELNHIKFDLVPATEGRNTEYQIPDDKQSWRDTDPNDVKNQLLFANKKYNNIVKPIVRLLKRWNAFNNYPYDSYELELRISGLNYKQDNYETGFFYASENIISRGDSYIANIKHESLIKQIEWIREYLERDDLDRAIIRTNKIFGIDL